VRYDDHREVMMVLLEDDWMRELAARPQVRAVTGVLRALQDRGLRDPAVASGFTRTLLLGVPQTDIDIHYVGDVPTATAERWLEAILAERELSGAWDIWNFQEHDPQITTTTYGYLVHFVSTIDCIYLASDGRLFDLTGRGASDARSRTLSLTHLTVQGYTWSAGQLCYLYLEGCRRIFLYGLTPTAASAEALHRDAGLWHACANEDRQYLRRRLREKLTAEQRAVARPLYASFGWDAVFDDDE
jgi:hypothetical protein